MLGWIALEEGPAKEALEKSKTTIAEIEKNIAKRGIVFSSGPEVAENKIEDTNTPTIMNYLESAGYSMTRGETLKDDKLYITSKLREAAELGGYGVIITTVKNIATVKVRACPDAACIMGEARWPFL